MMLFLDYKKSTDRANKVRGRPEKVQIMRGQKVLYGWYKNSDALGKIDMRKYIVEIG